MITKELLEEYEAGFGDAEDCTFREMLAKYHDYSPIIAHSMRVGRGLDLFFESRLIMAIHYLLKENLQLKEIITINHELGPRVMVPNI